MAEKALHQMIAAYTIGCLDKENFIQFMNYVLNRGDLPRSEMGELQNVIALIPSLLDLETPPTELKDQVAKRIIEFEGELKTKVEEKPKPDNMFSKISAGEEQMPRSTESLKQPAEQIPKTDRPTLIQQPLYNSQKVNKTLHENVYTHQAEPKKRSSVFPWVMFLIAALGVIVVAFYFNTINHDLKTEISNIRLRLSGLQKEIASSNRFLNEHIDLIEFFNYKNVEIVNLQSSETVSEFYGKLLISFESGIGLLQLKNIEPLSNDEIYQLWLINKTNSLSVANIMASPDIEYYKISNIPQVDKKDIRLFIITKENKAGSVIPQGKTYLFGTFNGSQIKDAYRK